jgi:hypothetical protein
MFSTWRPKKSSATGAKYFCGKKYVKGARFLILFFLLKLPYLKNSFQQVVKTFQVFLKNYFTL